VSSYSTERKQAILSKLLPPNNKSVASVAREEGVAGQTLYNWRKQAREQGQSVPGKKTTSDQWSHETKFAVVVETAALSESELGEYRNRGQVTCLIKYRNRGQVTCLIILLNLLLFYR